MKPSRQLRTKLIAILLGLTGTLAASVGFYYEIYDTSGLERLAVDFRFRHFNREIQDSNQVCIVAIDDGSLASFGQWPWPRTYLAQIVNLLGELDSREVLIDLIFSTPKQPGVGEDEAEDTLAGLTEDDALARACRKQGRSVLACYFTPGPDHSVIFDLLLEDFTLRPEALAEKSNLPLAEVRTAYLPMRKLAARELIRRELNRNAGLDKYAATRTILGANWVSMTGLREELERAFDYCRTYAYLRYKAGNAGWMIETPNLPPSIASLPATTQMELPVTKLSANCTDFGFVNFQPDPDGKIRDVALLSCYDRMIFRQLALAGICQHRQVNPADVKIYSNRLEVPDSPTDVQCEASVFATSQPNRSEIPLNRRGKLTINWHAPYPDQWWRSFKNVVPAGGLLKVAFNQESLRKNEELLRNAMPIAVKNLLPDSHEHYVKLQKQLAMLQNSLEEVPAEAPAPPIAIRLAAASQPAGPTAQPTTSAPATTIEEDLIAKFKETRSQVEAIETEARVQLDWLYQQLDNLPPAEQVTPEHRLIRDLWRCVHRPEEIRQINAELEATITRQLADLAPLVRDRIVLIGYTGSATADFVPTPVFNRCPGVAVHATILNQLLQKAFLYESDRNTDLLIILVLGTLTSILAAQRSAFEGLIWMILFLAGFAAFSCYVVFEKLHIISSMVGPAVAVVLSWSLVSFYRQLTEGRARRLFANRLGQYTSPALVRRIVEDPRRMVIHPERVRVSCYFSDISGFTPLSEKLGPEKTVQFLNIYLKHMSEALEAHEAFINKFQGDGIFAFFNPPLNPQNDHARRACLAAVESQQLLGHIGKHLREAKIELEKPLRMRVGISTGPAVVGDCGSERKFDYTCLGDTVNLGSRLESANKVFGTRIMICERTRKAMGNDLAARLLGRIRVAGREQPVVVHELVGYREENDDQMEFVELFEKMVQAYWRQEFDQLPAMLDRLEILQPNDKSVGIYRIQMDRLGRFGPRAFQDGVIELEVK